MNKDVVPVAELNLPFAWELGVKSRQSSSNFANSEFSGRHCVWWS